MISDPFNRLKLMDLLRPPDGFQLDEAIGTTYSLDLPALLVAPVAFTLFDAEDRDGQIRLQSLEVLESLRRYARKLTLFCHAGRILTPTARFTQFVHIENVVVECLLPDRPGSFHPKVWALRFKNETGDVVYRLLCLTRNLAFDQSWDTALTLEGPLGNRNIARNRPLADFVSALPSFARSEPAEDVRPRIERIAGELRRVDFELPPGVEEIRFWPMGIDGYRANPIPNNGSRLLVISPFLAKSTLESLARGRDECTLISTMQALAEVGGKPSSFTTAFTLNDVATAEPRADDEVADSGERVASGLHAKCYVVENGWKASIFTGSANATRAGFSANVEFLAELEGPRRLFGIDALLAREEGSTRLIDLLVELRDSDPLPEIDEQALRLDKLLEEARGAIVTCGFVLVCSASEGEKHMLSLIARAPQRLPDGVSATCWPVTLADARAVPADPVASPAAEFSDVTTLALSRFLNFELVAGEGEHRRRVRFALTLPLEGAPLDREEQVLRSVLTDRARLVEYLLLLVADEVGAYSTDANALDSTLTGEPAAGNGFRTPALLETFLRALDRAPERLDHVHRLVSDLRKTDDGAKLLPPDFDAVWSPIWAARERRRAWPAS